MTVEEACAAIMGDELFNSVFMDMGLHWAVVAAVADPRAAEHPEALAVLREHTDSAA